MEWKTVTAEQFCTRVTDGTHDSPKRQEVGRYLITSKHLSGSDIDFSSAYKISEEDYQKIIVRSNVEQYDILFSMIGTIGNTYRVTEEAVDYAVKNMAIFKFGGNKGDSSWFYYWLKSPQAQAYISQMQAGSTQGYLTLATLRSFPVAVPDHATQDKIVAILSSLDDKIENNNRINRNLEAQAQALFKSWFVDFEPFGGVMPEDWREYQLSELADVVGGYSYKGSELMPSEDAMATIKNFDRKGYFKLDGYKEIQISGRFKNTQILNLFDVVVAHTDITQQADIIGNPAIILSKGSYRNIIMSMDLCKVQPTHYAISSAFLYCLLKDSRFKSHALGYVNGTTVLHMSKKALPEYKVFLPSNLTKVQELGDQLQNLYKRYSVYLEENQRLAALRDTLLPKLMRGEIEL